jgi:hypothetical protein
MTNVIRRTLLGVILVLSVGAGRADASTVQGFTFEKATGLGIGTTVFLFGCCQMDTVAPNYTYSFANVSPGTWIVSANLPPSYGGFGTAEYSVCTNATGACHTEASYVASPNFIAQVTVPASGFVDVWWRFTPTGVTPTPQATATPPAALADYVVFGMNKLPPAQQNPGRVTIGDRSFIVDGNVGLNEYTAGTQSLNLGNSVSMPDGSAVVSFKCTSSFVPSPPPSDTSIFNLFADPNLSVGNCQNFARGTVYPLTPPILSPSPLPTFAPGNAWSFPPSAMLTPGAFGDASVPSSTTLELTGGHYEFASLKVQTMAKLLVNAPSTINIKGTLTVAEFGNFGPNKLYAVNPNDIHVNSGCGTDNKCSVITIDRASHVGMALYAPNAQLNLNRSVRGKGQFVANNVNGDQTLLLRRVQAPIVGPNTQFTTLTQTEYGATTGRANDPSTGLVTLHQDVLPVTLGAPGIRSLTVPDQTALECFLPATGSDPAALCAAQAQSSVNDCSVPAVPNNQGFPEFMTVTDTCDNVLDEVSGTSSKGQGGGTLTGEALAAKLNVALSEAGATLPGLGDFIIPPCLCTNTTAAVSPSCSAGRKIDNTNQQVQGAAAGLEDGLTTVSDLIAFADQALGSDCSGSGICTSTCGTAFAPPDPVRIGEMAWALQSINECFSGTAPGGAAPSVITCPGACPTPPDACPFP